MVVSARHIPGFLNETEATRGGQMLFKRLFVAMYKALKALVMAPFIMCAAILRIIWYILCIPVGPNPEEYRIKVLENLRLFLASFINPLHLFARGICEFVADAILLPGSESYIRRKK